MAEIIWQDRKRTKLFGLPWTFTKYSISSDRLFIKSGFFHLREEEVRLYRITDMSSERSLTQRMFGIGTIHIYSSDKTLGNFDLINIKNIEDVREMLSELVEKNRDEKRVSTREFVGGIDSDDDDEEFSI